MADGDYLDPFDGIHTQAAVLGKTYMYILYTFCISSFYMDLYYTLYSAAEST